MIEYGDIKRQPKSDKYFLGDKLVFELIPHETYEKMFYINFTVGGRTKDFYSKTRAGNIARRSFLHANGVEGT